MTYNEWKDELKSNLLSVSAQERKRVLDYYAEAYADRRDAGFSEREIIEDFGAPYDAAQRILSDRSSSYDRYDGAKFDDLDDRRDEERERERRKNEEAERKERERYEREDRRREREREREYARERRERDRREAQRARSRYDDDGYDDYYHDGYDRRRKSHPVLFIIVCIILAVPIFGVTMGLVGITIGFCVAPFAMIIAGAASIGGGVWQIIAGFLGDGLATLGTGAVSLGLGLILMPVFFFVVKLLWKLFKGFMGWLRSLFNDGRRYV